MPPPLPDRNSCRSTLRSRQRHSPAARRLCNAFLSRVHRRYPPTLQYGRRWGYPPLQSVRVAGAIPVFMVPSGNNPRRVKIFAVSQYFIPMQGMVFHDLLFFRGETALLPQYRPIQNICNIS